MKSQWQVTSTAAQRSGLSASSLSFSDRGLDVRMIGTSLVLGIERASISTCSAVASFLRVAAEPPNSLAETAHGRYLRFFVLVSKGFSFGGRPIENYKVLKISL
jgi:hypothetical protein